MKRKLLGISLAVLMVAAIFALTSCDPFGGGEEHQHDYTDWETITDPTCTSDGEMIGRCDCGDEISVAITSQGHSFNDWITVKHPTCQEEGLKQKKCAHCGVIKEETKIAKIDHTIVTIPSQDATCTEDGYSEWSYCATCGTTIKEKEIISATEHSYVDTIVPPTCKEDGYTTHTCHCGNSYIDSIIKASGHNVVVDLSVDPTCTTKGLTEGSHCERCGDVLVAQDTIPMIDHSYESTVTLPTCTEDGYTTHTCYCGDTYADAYVDALGHIEAIDTAVDSTCTTDGLTDGKHCSVCDTVIVKQEIIPAKGHTPGEWKYDVEPTCTTQGSKYRECTVCLETIDSRLVPENGHTVVPLPSVPATCTEDGLTQGSYCSVCNVTLVAQVTIPAAGHKYTSVITNPTCEEDGYTVHTCVCGDTYTDTYTNMLGHQIAVDSAVKPTCTTSGLTEGSHCKRCGKVLVAQDIIPMIPHSYESTITLPTCTEEGYTTHTCNCGDAYVDSYVNALGHTEVIDEAISATCTTSGLTEGKHCIICNTKTISQKVTPATGHTEVIDQCTPPTCTQAGLAEGVHCSICSKILVEQQIIDKIDHNYIDGTCVMCKSLQPTPNEYFVFSLNQDGTYTISAANITMPSQVVIPNTYNGYPITCIADQAFYKCHSLTSIVIPDSLTSIGSSAFRYCYNLTSVVIPNSVTSIGSYAFYDCDSLTSIVIPDSVTTIGYQAFSGCSSLYVVYNDSDLLLEVGSTNNGYVAYDAKILVDNGVTTYADDGYNYTLTDDGFLFREKDSKYELISYIGGEDTVTLPENIKGNSYDLYSMRGVVNVIIPESFTTINDYAFYDCDSLVRVTIPDSVTSIGSYAFYGCSSLTEVYYNGSAEEWNSISIGGYNTQKNNATLYYYSESHPTTSGNFWHWVDGEVKIWE